MSKSTDVERIKADSRGLRGTIADELASEAPKFGTDAASLLKFHGVYQQDDRDRRKAARDDGGAALAQFMVRTKNPGGYVPAGLFVALAELAETFGNGTLRATTRQGFQLHGVAKAGLKATIATINARLGSTLGACGDINRNVMAPAAPYAAKPYAIARETAHAIADLLTPRTGAYYEIWQDGELAHTSRVELDPLYRDTYLPRKFKIAVAVPGDNSVDILTNDLGVVPLLDDAGVLLGFDLYAGGGLGMTHRKPNTFARLADELAFVAPHDLLAVVRAIVEVQRDHGDRSDRKHARLKYTIADRGLAWFVREVERYARRPLAPFRPLPPWKHRDYLGWHEQGDGRWFLGLPVENGRISDADTRHLKRALVNIVERFTLDLVLTPQQNVLIVDVPADARAAIDAMCEENGVARVETISLLERNAMACPALPTCGLALAEAERALPALVDDLERVLVELGLDRDTISVRMTGCPNGCARPYMADIGIVGVSAGRYHVSLGGSTDGVRLSHVFRELVAGDELVAELRPVLAAFARERAPGETFADYCVRAVLPARDRASLAS